MTKDQFSQALALYTRALTSGTFAARAATKDAILAEHARLVDGIAELLQRHREGEDITYAKLADLLQSDPVLKSVVFPAAVTPLVFGCAPPVKILGEESGFTDGLPDPAPALRWLPGDSKPTKPGIYPTKINMIVAGKPTEREGRSYWSGEHWGVQRDKADHVQTEGYIRPSAFQRKTWQDRSGT